MLSSTGHAHWTVELECDILLIIGECGVKRESSHLQNLNPPGVGGDGRKLKGWGKQPTSDQAWLTPVRSPTAMSAATDSPKKSKLKPSKEKKSQGKPQNERLKIVVRRLPPNLPEEIFWQSVSEWVSDETVSWKSFHTGKVKKRYAFFCLLEVPTCVLRSNSSVAAG